MEFIESGGQLGRLSTNNKTSKHTARHVPCFPLETLLFALNRTHVDFLSLDIQGLELAVLETIPYNDVDITVISAEVEHGGPGAGDRYTQFMKRAGYNLHKKIKLADRKRRVYADDIMFVKV